MINEMEFIVKLRNKDDLTEISVDFSGRPDEEMNISGEPMTSAFIRAYFLSKLTENVCCDDKEKKCVK